MYYQRTSGNAEHNIDCARKQAVGIYCEVASLSLPNTVRAHCRHTLALVLVISCCGGSQERAGAISGLPPSMEGRKSGKQTRAGLPLVSIIIPCHNAMPGLDECLASCASQDYEGPLEVSIFDDSSTDGSDACIRYLCYSIERHLLASAPARTHQFARIRTHKRCATTRTCPALTRACRQSMGRKAARCRHQVHVQREQVARLCRLGCYSTRRRCGQGSQQGGVSELRRIPVLHGRG